MGLAAAAQWRDRARGLGAARLLLTHVRLARARAVQEGVHVGLAFTTDAAGRLAFRAHRDGNANGVRRADITSGVDEASGPIVRLDEWFPGSAMRVPYSFSAPEQGGAVSAGSDPVRLSGSGTILSCGPAGSVTSGTIYVAGPDDAVYAVRAFGATGRLRLFEHRRSDDRWLER
jgi:hypothetical protein